MSTTSLYKTLNKHDMSTIKRVKLLYIIWHYTGTIETGLPRIKITFSLCYLIWQSTNNLSALTFFRYHRKYYLLICIPATCKVQFTEQITFPPCIAYFHYVYLKERIAQKHDNYMVYGLKNSLNTVIF